MVGFRKETPSRDQIFQILDWLRCPKKGPDFCVREATTEATTEATMITTTKATRGIIINICNYSFYQDFKNYGSNDDSNIESNDEKLMDPNTINNNDNKEIYIPPIAKAIVPQGGEKSKKQKPVYDHESKPYRCAVFLDNAISERLGRPKKDEATLQKWAAAFDLTNRKDKWPWKKIGSILELLCDEDDKSLVFWRKKILSGDSFRRNFEKILSDLGDAS